MKSPINYLLPIFCLLLTFSVYAQINSGVGYMHGSTKKGDTSTVSKYNSDRAPKEVKADTTVISRKPTSASEARAEGHSAGNGQSPATADTTAQTASPTMADTTASAGTATTTTATEVTDCVSPTWKYAAIGFGILSLLLLLLLLLRRKDDNQPNRARV